MHTCNRDGELVGAIRSAAWSFESGLYCIPLDDGGYLALSQEDVAAINEIQDRGQKEADAGISAAHDAWERRRFLNETARELFVDLFRRMVDFNMEAETRSSWAGLAAAIASDAAGSLLNAVEIERDVLRDAGLDVS